MSRLLHGKQTLILIGCLVLFAGILTGQENRSYGGWFNNVEGLWGALYDEVVLVSDPAFSDGISVPAGVDRPNPRVLSNMIFNQREMAHDPLGLSAYVWAWGQFIDHDITLSPNHESEIFPIQVPTGDKYFDPDFTGERQIIMMRSDPIKNTGTGTDNPRRFYNATTAFIDGSGVYGSDEEVANWLRTFEDGKLKVSEGNLLPYNTKNGEEDGEIDEEAPHMDIPFPYLTKWFVAGDPRANENPVLTALHTLFVLEHNRLCDEVKLSNPDWDDEEIYQKARKIVGGIIQAIVYEEWLPSLGVHLDDYTGYNGLVHPGIMNVFSTAAYRYGHSTITPNLKMMNNDAQYIKEGEISLRHTFFNPAMIQKTGGIEPFLIGSAFLVEQDLDCKIIDELRNFLFGAPGSGGLDLASININRGRDRGLADFNTIRSDFGLEPYNSFDQISRNPLLNKILNELYKDINNIDPWVGMLAEEHMPNALFGPTSMRILSKQFSNLQIGDRFYYEIDQGLTSQEKLDIKNTRLVDVIRRNTNITIIHDEVFRAMSTNQLVNRTIDGTLNNPYNPNWGSSDEKFIMETPIHYSDGISSASGEGRPNPRVVSNQIFAQDNEISDPLELSAYVWGWGQFIDHDITLSPEHPSELMSISIPKYDVFFDPDGTGTQEMVMHRSDYDPVTGTDISNPRVPINAITAYIDGSAVYGSDTLTATWLRTGHQGKLKTSTGNLLPYNTISGEAYSSVDPNAPEMAIPFPHVDRYFVAGDIRANENPFLTSLHTLFVREHNRLCDSLLISNPDWTDEAIYQYARKIVGAEIQAIVYEEWLPALGMTLPEYKSYDPQQQPGITNVFATAAYRYGHSTIGPELVRMDEHGQIIPEGNVSLRESFFNPGAIPEVGGIEPYLQGMATVVEQDFDCHVIDDLRNFLFGAPGQGGLDLVSLNINRGRDRGLADYNTIRSYYDLDPISTFTDLSADPILNQHFASVYKEVNRIDPWAGFLAENHMSGALFGEAAMYIIRKQFIQLRDGDSFYYENDPILPKKLIKSLKRTTLASIIKKNTPLTLIQDEIFRASQISTAAQPSETTSNMLRVYPNPAYGVIHIDFGELIESPQRVHIEIVTVSGQLVQVSEEHISQYNNLVKIQLDQNMPRGMYLIKTRLAGKIQNQLFVKS